MKTIGQKLRNIRLTDKVLRKAGIMPQHRLLLTMLRINELTAQEYEDSMAGSLKVEEDTSYSEALDFLNYCLNSTAKRDLRGYVTNMRGYNGDLNTSNKWTRLEHGLFADRHLEKVETEVATHTLEHYAGDWSHITGRWKDASSPEELTRTIIAKGKIVSMVNRDHEGAVYAQVQFHYENGRLLKESTMIGGIPQEIIDFTDLLKQVDAIVDN